MSDLFQITTTNSGELAEVIDEETEYDGKFRNIKISGYVILNQCGTLLTINKYKIKEIIVNNYF